MRRCTGSTVLLSIFLTFVSLVIGGCGQTESTNDVVKSVYTYLNPESCTEFIDQDDPNSTTHQLCDGVSGYALIMRHVDSGRKSIDVLTPRKKEFPLDYQEFITRHMSHLEDKAEWRILIKNQKEIPIALVVRVHVHESEDGPERITHSYLAVAKITSDEICITDRILDVSVSREQILNVADSAQKKECLQPLPSTIID